MKTIGVFQLQQMRFDCLDFEGEWLESFGRPEVNFSCLIYGPSGNGKTDFCMKLAKYLSQFDKVLYSSREEGISNTLQEGFARNNMMEVSGRVIVAQDANLEHLVEYLEKRSSPRFVIIDSLDYMRLTTEQFKLLRAKFAKKSFIITSWMKGKGPQSQYGKDIEYMSDIKIKVVGYVAYVRSRYGGNAPFVIWQEGHERYKNKLIAKKSVEEDNQMKLL